MSSVLYVLIAILIFGFLIFVHELGHYICARLFDVSIKEFSLGMGPKLLSHTSKKNGIVYSLRLFPIGGYVSMIGENEESDDEGSLNKKKAWKRFIIVSAGAIMNIICGIVLMTILVAASKNIYGTTILRFRDEGVKSESYGLQVGDEIVKIADSRVHMQRDLAYEIMYNATEPVDITVIRDGERIVVEDVQFPIIEQDGMEFGCPDFVVAAADKTIGNIIKHSWYSSFSTIKMIWQSLLDFATGKYGISQMSGPVGIATTAVDTAKTGGISSFLYLFVVITMNLGVFNLLPLPALDGGRLLFILVEMIRRKPVNPKYEGYVHFAGIVILMLLMIFITFKDVLQLLS